MSAVGTSALVGQMLARLPSLIAEVHQRLIRKVNSAEVYYPNMRQDFALLFEVKQLTVSLGATGAGAFQLCGSALVFDPAPIQNLLHAALADIDRAASERGYVLSEAECEEYLEGVAVIYVLHELRHPQQGIGDYHEVIGLKKTAAGRMTLAIFDLHADRDAVALWAALRTVEQGGDRADYIKLFRTWLFATAAGSVTAFPYSANRPSKLARAVGLSVMVGRFSLADEGFVEPQTLASIPLDSVIEVLMDEARADITLLAADPKRVIASFEAPELTALLHEVCAGRFQDAIDHAAALWIRAA